VQIPARQRVGGGNGEGGDDAGQGSGEEEGAKHMVDAIEEAMGKFWKQVSKPVTTLVTSIHNPLSADFDSNKSTTVRFQDLRHVHIMAQDRVATLCLEGSSGAWETFPLTQSTKSVQDALRHGFQSALVHPDNAANWGELRTALREEQRRQQDILPELKDQGAGRRTLEVFEVERFLLRTGSWTAPFLFTDRDLQWRWVNANGQKHSNLKKDFKQEDAATTRSSPPCEIDSEVNFKRLFRPVGQWEIVKNDGTDDDGWSYGLFWKSSTWEATHSMFDLLRRRKWQLVYDVLSSAPEGERQRATAGG